MCEQTPAPNNTNIGIGKIKLGRSILRQGRFAEAERKPRDGYSRPAD